MKFKDFIELLVNFIMGCLIIYGLPLAFGLICYLGGIG